MFFFAWQVSWGFCEPTGDPQSTMGISKVRGLRLHPVARFYMVLLLTLRNTCGAKANPAGELLDVSGYWFPIGQSTLEDLAGICFRWGPHQESLMIFMADGIRGRLLVILKRVALNGRLRSFGANGFRQRRPGSRRRDVKRDDSIARWK